MEYVQIGLLSAILIVVIILVIKAFKKNKHIELVDEQKELQNELKIYFQKEYGDLKYEMAKLFSESNKMNQNDLNTFKDNMMLHIDRHLKEINEKVEARLGQGFEKTSETFTNVMERLTKIDEAQKKIELLSTEVVSLNDLLTDKKARGTFGEVQLYQLLTAIFGNNPKLYERQKMLSNKALADAVVYAPEPLGMVAIDSKFPLDNYKRMVDQTLGDSDRKTAEKEFKLDVKKHINDIRTKYIITGETSDQAFMFVPAEAIFAEIAAYHQDLIDYASKYSVWIVSPTTLISQLSMIQVVVNNLKRDEQAKVIIDELNKLGDEFKRYVDRWDKLKRSIDTVAKTADQVQITSQKISTKFQNISEAKFDQIEFDEESESTDELD
ncbi:MAG: DNA recombination protein RmuC [Acholeplasmataceae bacterium]|jgi:DNA recombination protein RmuC|nr:DNA recombination protein RmuC [Acholeplasmataceae bacterium]MDD4193846.1 DNA recombination protein RmuC [Acholeplasmataceae bacterium]MDY0338224.1 DNA recombination protein RmuC [Acholeplasmataceae bacterium]